MASTQGAKKGRTYIPVNNQIEINTLRMTSQDIAAWKSAIDAARNVLNPRRRLLYELYDNIILDGHLTSVMAKRVTHITNKRIIFVKDGDEGAVDDQVRELVLERPWFHQFNKLAMSAKSYGHALIELIPEAGLIKTVDLVNRANVVPERKFVAWHYANLESGFNYELEQPASQYLVEIGGAKDFGLLLQASQYVIYKRGGFGDWAQYAELFGMPFRVGKYDPYDENTRQKLSEGLDAMGGAGFAVIPNGTSIDFHSAAGSGNTSSIYKDLVSMCNAEISKIFLGQTLTTEQGDKGARALGDVHKDVEDEIGVADMIEHEYMLNWVLKPKLEALGYPIAGGRFKFEKLNNVPMDKQIDVALKVASQVPIDESYWYETFGVPKPDSSKKADPKDDDSQDPEGGAGPSSKKKA